MQHSQPESSLMRAEDDDDGSDNELLETQTWRVQRLERNEFLDTLKVSCHILEPKQSLQGVLLCILQSQQDDSLLCEQDQQVLSMIHDSSGKLTYLCLYSNEVLTSLLYLLQKEHNPQIPLRDIYIGLGNIYKECLALLTRMLLELEW